MSKTLDIINDLDRYTAQTKSQLICLLSEDQISHLNEEDTVNAVWAIEDQIDRIKAKLKDLWAEIKEVV